MIIYRSKRIGQNGKEFLLYKFRTMRDEPGFSSTSANDPRITKIGKLLRKTKLDEIPQLLNLLKGDMTLIGWRPEDPRYLSTIHPEVLKTKPGIFGLAQLWDFDEEEILRDSTDPDKDYEEKIMPQKRTLELEFARNDNWYMRFNILIRTLGRLLWKSTQK